MTVDAAVPTPATETVDAQNPWPGLEAFKEEDHNFFHGRETEIEELHRLVQRERLTVLFGVSGLGKTSLLQAGLFPAMRNENVLPVRIRLNYSPGMPELSTQIEEAITREAAANNIEAPRFEGTLWESFHRQDADFWNQRNRVVIPLLVFDQFEEVFTRGRETPERAARRGGVPDRAGGPDRGAPARSPSRPGSMWIRPRRGSIPSSATTTRFF